MSDDDRGAGAGQHVLRAAAPAQVPMVTITQVGLGLWGLGLVVTGVLGAARHLPIVAPVTCAFGLLIGLVTLRWAHRRT